MFWAYFNNLKKCSLLVFSILFFTIIFIQSINLSAAESLSYSGRLVQTNGAPIAGPVNLKIELAYTDAPTVILCSQDFAGVVLSNGVFHLKLDLSCGNPPTLTDILAAVPINESAAIRVTDVTHSKVYSYQALHSMPFASLSGMAKQLVQMGAANNEVLKWNNTTKKWEPGTPGGGGTVTNVTGNAPISISSGATTPTISISQAGSLTDGYLSSADWNIFNAKQGSITAGTTAQYYRGDKSWQTLNSTAVAEGTNLYFTNARVLGVPLTGFSSATGAIVDTDSVLQAFGKSQGQIDAINTASANFLIKNGTDSISGVVNVGTIGLLKLNYDPVGLTDAANKAYVDTKLDLAAGGTVTGAVSLDTSLKLKNGGATNYVTLRAPALGVTAYTLSLPINAGAASQVLTTDGAGLTSWTTPSTTATPSGAAGGDLSGTYPNPSITGLAATKISGGTVDNTEFDFLNGVTSSIQTQLNAKEGSITGAATTTYFRGDKTFVTLNTAVVPESGNLYFTNSRVLAVPLTGFVASNTAIVDTDTVLEGLNKAQGQITNLNSIKANVAGDTFTGDVNFNTQIKLKDGAVANYVILKAPASGTTTHTLTLPGVVGTSGQVLSMTGTAGVLAWTTPTTTATPTGAAGGDLSGTYPNPSITGLSAAKISAGTVDNTEFDFLNGVTSSIQTQLNAKEGTITAGTTAQYYRGDKSFVTLDTLAVPENTRLYFTEARVLGTSLTGFVADNTAITATDTVFIGLEKSQGQITNLNSIKANVAGDTFTGDVNFNTQVKLKDGAAAAYVSLKAPASGTTSHTLTLPGTVGTSGQVLSMTGTAGVLAWTSPATTAAPSGTAGGDLSGTYPNPSITGLSAAKISAGTVDNTEFDFLNGVTSSIQTQLNAKQATDSTLTALAAYNTNGIMVQTAADTFVGRSIAGTANRVSVTNGDGIAGNPTLDIPTALLPSPVAGDVGKFLKATAADTSVWTALGLSDITTALGFTPINKAGDSLSSGTFTFSGTALLRTLDPVGGTDVANKQYVDSYGQWTKSGSDIYRSTGNVGIGTTTPGAKAHINYGNTPVTAAETLRLEVTGNVSTDRGPYISFYAPNSAGTSKESAHIAGVQSGLDTGGSLLFKTSAAGAATTPSERMRIDSAGNVGIGTTAPIDILHISKVDASSSVIIDSNSNAASTSSIVGRKSRGTTSTPTAVLAEDYLFNIGARGYGATGFSSASRALIALKAEESWSDVAQGSLITFETTQSGGVSRTEKVRISGNGNVGIGTITPVAKLDVNGDAHFANTNYFDSVSSVPTASYVPINLTSATATLAVGNVYRVNLVVPGTGTSTGAVYIIYQTNATTWAASLVSANGNTSNHPLLRVNVAGTGLEVYHNHASTYSIHSFVQTTTTTNTTVTGPTFFGLESAMTNFAGYVGVGTSTPQSRLDVNGSLRIGADATACSATIAGAMKFNTPNVEYCNGSNWIAFGAGDATLTSLAAFNTNGILVQTAADTFVGRTIAGTANRLSVTNGDGVSGNPTLNIPTALLPSPVIGDVGKFLKATATDTSVWTALGLSDITTALGYTPLNKAGDTLTTGTITLSGAALLRTLDPIAGTDVANKQYVDSYGQWTKGTGGNAADIYRSTGNVGIGTPTPNSLLHLNANAPVLIMQDTSNLNSTNTFNTYISGRDSAGVESWWMGEGSSSGKRVGLVAPIAGYDINIQNSSGQIYLSTAGNVGIGTTSPGALLQLGQSALTGAPGATVESNRLRIATQTHSGGSFDIFERDTTAQANLDFRYGANNLMTLVGSGNVGIGTTTPSAPLTIGDSVSRRGYLLLKDDGTNQPVIQMASSLAGGRTYNIYSGYSSAGNFDISDNTAGNVSRLAINSTGNVGIGNTNPQAKLDVSGDVYISGTGGINQHSGAYTAGAGVREIFRVGSSRLSTGGIFSLSATRGGFVHSSMWSWSTTHNSTGKGILTQLSGGEYSNIVVYLDVAGDGSAIISADWGTAQDYGLSINKMAGGFVDLTANNTDWSTVNGSYLRVRAVTTISSGFQSVTGVFAGSVSAASYITTSDLRLKKNIATIDKSLEKILGLRGVEFDWKANNEHEVGLIAQEVEKIEPTLVITREDGFKGVKYSNIVALLIEAVKSEHKAIAKNANMLKVMQSSIMDHERKIASLEEENQKLKNENKEIRERLLRIEKIILKAERR